MREFEVAIESMTPCGGEKYARREIREIETDDPVAWVREETRVQELTVAEFPGELVITTEQYGYIKRFTFTEI